MDSLSPQVVSAAKLPILNPNEFDLWKIMIEQYFLMTDYSLWEVILNGNSLVPKRVIEGVLQPIDPITTEQMLARKNELPVAHTATQNLAFVSSSNTDSTTDSVSAAASVTAICAKLPIDVDDLEEIDLRWQMAMLTMRARRFLQKIGINLDANGPTSMGFDMSRVECYNCHKKRHFDRECRSPKDSRRTGAADPQKEEPANFALMAFSSLSSSSDTEVPSFSKACSKAYTQLYTQYDKLTPDFYKSQFDVIPNQTESDWESWPPSSLYDRFQPSVGYHVVPPPYIGTFMPSKPDLVFNTAPIAIESYYFAFNVQLSPLKSKQDLSHTTRPTSPIIEDWVYDSEDEYETKASQFVPSFVQSSEQVKSLRHSVQPVETSIPAATPTLASLKGNHKKYAPLTHKNPQKHMVPTTVLTQSKPVFNTTVRPVSAAMPKINVTRPRYAHPVVTKSKPPIRRHITRSPSLKTSNSPPRVTVVQAPVGNPQHALKDNRVIDSGCSRHMTRNMSYLSDFKELNGGYVAFGGNPKGGKISSKG
nr:ribonuclease H-like domain-containing protein [Tanacetum cinerariifolium]